MQKTALFTRIALFTLAALIATAATGERPGDWSLSVGPAWRSKVKSAISGQAGGPTVTPSRRVIYDKDVVTRRPWSADEVEIVQDPDYPGQQDFLNYAAVQTGSETIVTPLYGAAELNSSNRDRPLGVSLTAGRDLYTAGCFSAGLTLRFAGYWDMKTQASGMAGGGTIQSRSWRDYYLFKDGPIPPTTTTSPTATLNPNPTPPITRISVAPPAPSPASPSMPASPATSTKSASARASPAASAAVSTSSAPWKPSATSPAWTSNAPTNAAAKPNPPSASPRA